MKTLLLITLFFFAACAAPNTQNRDWEWANEKDFSNPVGKKVRFVRYCDACGPAGDMLIITFEDSTSLKVYAYKYTMRIYE